MRRVITTYFLQHYRAAINSFSQFSRAPFTSLMTCLIIGITLALPTALFTALKNFSAISGNLQQTAQITLYLKLNNKESDVTQLAHDLQADTHIASIKIISPAQGLNELQQQAGFQNISSELPEYTLPWVLVVLPQSPNDLKLLAQSLQKLPQVDSVQLDEIWVKRLASLISLAKRAIYVIAIFLSIAVFLIISNVIRSATQYNEKEIEIIKLIGGTHSFIRRPFLYAGMLYGLFGGIIAWQLVDALMLFLKTPVNQIVTLYNSSFEIIGIGLANTLILLGLSIFLGLIASWLAVTRNLKTC